MRDYRAGGEVRVTDPESGAQKGVKPTQLGSLDPVGLEEMGRVGGYGATKYARYNFIKGYAYSLSVDAMFRHMLAWLQGEDFDPESGLHHMAHAAWHGHTIVGFQQRGVGTDDRPPRSVTEPELMWLGSYDGVQRPEGMSDVEWDTFVEMRRDAHSRPTVIQPPTWPTATDMLEKDGLPHA